MVHLKCAKEIAIIKEGAQILSKTQGLIAENINEGITTAKLNILAEEFIKDHGGVPSFKGYHDFPATLCISVNEQVVHGVPSSYVLRAGDIVSVDCGVYYKGFHSDMAFTYPVETVNDEVMRLLRVTKQSLLIGIDVAVFGNRVGDIGFFIQEYAAKHKCSVVRKLTGHGVGKRLHEDPSIPNYGSKGNGMKLQEGMVLAIEPMLNLGTHHIVQEKDGWTISTLDKKVSAHFEHTVAILRNKTEVLTTYKYIEAFFKI